MEDSPQVQAIRARYKASFLEKADMIVSCIGLVDHKEPSQTDFSEVKERLHKLAGSAGMYGYQDICDRARSGMLAIDDNDCVVLIDALADLRSLLISHA